MSGPTTSSRTERRTARAFRMLCASSTSLPGAAWRSWWLGGSRSDDVLHCLADLFVEHGPPEHIRSDNGPEFAAQGSSTSGLASLA